MSVPLGDILVKAEAGFACSKTKLVSDGISHLRPFNIAGDMTLDLSEVYQVPPEAAPAGKVGLEVGDLLFNNTNSKEVVGKVAYVNCPLSAGFSNHVTRLRLDTARADPAFIAWQLHSMWKGGVFQQRATQWVSQAAINSTAIKATSVILPPLPEQCRIVDILNRANGIRRLRREAQEKARRVIPALFVEMFGDPQRNPKGWPVATLGEIGQLDRGKSKHRPRNDPRLLGGPYPFIQTGDIANSGEVIRSFNATYSEFGLEQSKMWPNGTLCITIAANIADTGLLCFDACFPDSVVGFVPGAEANVSYVQGVLRFLKPLLETQAPQMAQKNINLQILRSLRVPKPPLDLQRAFASRVSDIQAMIAQQDRMAAASERLVQSLMAEVFG